MFIYKHFVIFGTCPNNGIINMNKNQINWKVKINSKWVLYFPLLLLQKEILFISAENTLKVVTLRTLLSPLSTTLFCPQSFLIRPDVEAFTHIWSWDGILSLSCFCETKKKKKISHNVCKLTPYVLTVHFYFFTIWLFESCQLTWVESYYSKNISRA